MYFVDKVSCRICILASTQGGTRKEMDAETLFIPVLNLILTY